MTRNILIYKKILGMLLLILSISLFLTACSKNVTRKGNSEIQNTSIINSNENNKDQMSKLSDFFMSSDGQKLLTNAWTFIKAYFNSDSPTMEKYLIEGKSAEPYNKVVFNNIDYINLQWSFSNMVSEDEISLTYIFQIKGDSLTYFDLDMKKVNNEWKVSDYGIEK